MQVQALGIISIYNTNNMNFQSKTISKPTITRVQKNIGCDSVSFTNTVKNNIKRVIILLGAPNSGKGTCAREISARYSIPQISTGDILRNEMKNETDLGKKVQSYMISGRLVPDDLVIDIFKTRIAKPDCNNGFILDGFPRTVQQAEKLEELLKKEKNIDVRVINLDVDENILYERSAKRYMCKDCSRTYSIKDYNPLSSKCECGGQLIKRVDDTPEVLSKRLESYKKQSLPLLDFYSDRIINFEVHDNSTQATKVISDILKTFDDVAC